MLEGSLLRSKLCAATVPPVSLFMAEMVPTSFQWRCHLFCTLSALEPVRMWARMVHSIPPPARLCLLAPFQVEVAFDHHFVSENLVL